MILRAARSGRPDLKILFFMTHPGFTRNYESTLALLAERGHRVHLAFDGPPQVGKPSAVDGLVRALPERSRTVRHPTATMPGRRWRAPSARTRNYLRYLHPRYRQATRLRERAVVWPLGPVLEALARLASRRAAAVSGCSTACCEASSASSRAAPRSSGSSASSGRTSCC